MEIDFSQIESAYQNVSKEVRAAFFSPETGEKVQQIGNKFEIPEEKMPQLMDTVSLTLLSLVRKADLHKTLQQELGVSEEVAQQLAQELGIALIDPLIQEKEVREKENATQEVAANKSQSQKHTRENVQPAPERPTHADVPRYTDDGPQEKQRPFSADPYRESLE